MGVQRRRDTELKAELAGLPMSVVEPTLVSYRSAGIGLFGVVMRFLGMPLEKMALFMNSSQVQADGRNAFRQSIKLTFGEGWLTPYRVVGTPSLIAWFLQYSVMGLAFQFFDHGLSKLLHVKPVYYGIELMEPPDDEQEHGDERWRVALKTCLSPLLASMLESQVSNRAEVQRFFGPRSFARLETDLGMANKHFLVRAAGPAFWPNCFRNIIMCQTTFLLTPITYKLYVPQSHKNTSTLFWYGLFLNVFVGNGIAITQQALWGRTLDYAAKHHRIDYRAIVFREGLHKEGVGAFFTAPKWFSRVLMNAPAQGVLPWFYNQVLPLGEPTLLQLIKKLRNTPNHHNNNIS